MKSYLTLFVFSVISISYVIGQQTVDALPPNPGDGKCYAKCIEPDEYKEEVVQVVKKPAHTKLEIVPAEYKTVTETVVLKPASKKYVYVPATYKDVYDTVWTKQDYNKLTVVPIEFRDDIEEIEIKASYGKWVAGDKDPDCPSIDPEDCRVFYFKEYPAVTEKIAIEKVAKKESTTSKNIPGKYTVVKRQEEVTPARYDVVEIPAETKEISKEVLVKDETTKKVEVPAEYEEVIKKVLVKKGGMTVWREVPCTIPEGGILLPITWNLGSAQLTPGARKIIDEKLITMANKKKHTIIEINSHTDARGSKEANLALSEKRALAVAEYLVMKGIDKNRIIAKGKGEGVLVNDCADGVKCSESEHAANRRTEFKLY